MSTRISVKQTVGVPPDQVYFAFTRAIALHEWLCDFATVAPRPGGRMYLWWQGDFYSAGEYISLEEDKSVAFTWFGRGDPGSSRVTATLQPGQGGTQVLLEHDLPDWKGWKGDPETFRKEWTASLENLASVLETGMDKRVFDRPMLGISLSDFTPAIARAIGVPVKEGLRLDGASENMGAYQAGLRKDDVLVSMDGKPITTDFGSLLAALRGRKGGEEVRVIYYRGPKRIETSMKLTKRPIPEIPWDTAELARVTRKKYDESLAALEACFLGVDEAEADFRPAPEEWSAREVLAHLIQNERHWLENLDDVIGGYERLSDDWGGNITPHMQAIVAAYQSTRGLLDELRRLSDELVSFLAHLPDEFRARKVSYWLAVNTLLEGTIPHNSAHIGQIKAAIAAARRQASR